MRTDLTSLPLSTLLKAQKSLKPSKSSHSNSDSGSEDDSDSSPESGPSTSKAQRLAEIKARLAEMQKRKGKAFGVQVEDEAGRVEREEKEEREIARLKRESKHA